MDKGTRIGWRSTLMAPVCFVIRSRVERDGVGGGGRRRNRPKEDRCPQRQNGPGVKG